MNDTEKMGIVGTRLFWKLFTSPCCRGYDDRKLRGHIRLFKLFMYWARLTNRKVLIKKMFFDFTGYSPFTFLELFITKTNKHHNEPFSYNYETPKDAWMDVFRLRLCAISLAIGGNSTVGIYNKFIEIERDWRIFLEKNEDKL